MPWANSSGLILAARSSTSFFAGGLPSPFSVKATSARKVPAEFDSQMSEDWAATTLPLVMP